MITIGDLIITIDRWDVMFFFTLWELCRIHFYLKKIYKNG